MTSEWELHDGLVWDEPSDDPQEQAFRDAINEEDRVARATSAQPCEPYCVHPFHGHEGPCIDEPPNLYDPRPDPVTHPEYWTE